MRKIMIVLPIALITILLTGCWDLSEPEKISMVSTLGINIADNNQIEIVFHDEAIAAGSEDKQAKSNLVFGFHKSIGSTISDAIQKCLLSNPQRVYLTHTKAIVLSEELVRSQGIRPVIDFLERNSEIRQNIFLLISKKGEFEKIFKPNAVLSSDTGKIIEGLIENRKENSFILYSKLKDFLELAWKPYCTPYALGIGASKSFLDGENMDAGYDNMDVNTYDVAVGDIAIFKNEKMVGWLVGEQSRGVLWVKGNIKGGVITVNFEGKKLSLKISHVKANKKPMIENKKMKININIALEAKISESNADVDFSEENVIHKVEKTLNEQIKKEIQDALKVSKDLNTDVFGFGNCFFGNYANYWNKNIKDNDIYYSKLDVNIQIVSNIQYIGLVKEPTKKVK